MKMLGKGVLAASVLVAMASQGARANLITGNTDIQTGEPLVVGYTNSTGLFTATNGSADVFNSVVLSDGSTDTLLGPSFSLNAYLTAAGTLDTSKTNSFTLSGVMLSSFSSADLGGTITSFTYDVKSDSGGVASVDFNFFFDNITGSLASQFAGGKGVVEIHSKGTVYGGGPAFSLGNDFSNGDELDAFSGVQTSVADIGAVAAAPTPAVIPGGLVLIGGYLVRRRRGVVA